MDEDGIFGECNPIGEPVFVDIDGNKFYSGVVVHNIVVKVGDCVAVRIEVDDETQDDFSYCQVLAIYEDHDPERGVLFEARWFFVPEEVEFGSRKRP